MKASDELIEAMCEAFSDGLWPVAWPVASEQHRLGVRNAMRAALAVLPEPATAADALPVPGAAVRALPARLRRAYGEGTAWHTCAKLIEEALEQDGLASQALPTRESIAEMLHKENGSGYSWAECPQEYQNAYYRQANDVLKLLARRAAADGVRPVVCTLGQAQRIEQTSGMGPFACTAYQLRDAINAELRPATDEAEALRKRLAEATTLLNAATAEHDGLRKMVKDLPPERCPITGEHFFMCITDPSGHWVPTYGGPYDSYTIPTRGEDGTYTRFKYDHDDGGWDESGETVTVRLVDEEDDIENEERIADLEAQLASVTAELDTARKFGRVAEEERDEALAKLAARPAPVVIDEALAERVLAVYYKGDSTRYGRYLGADMLATLRAVFGDRASVSVPQGDSHEAVIVCKWGYALTAKGQVIIWSGDESRLNKDDLQKVVDAVTDYDLLRAELEKTRAELEAYRATIRTLASEVVDLREQLDALRAACTPTEKEAEARDHVKPDRLGASDWTVRQLAGFYGRVQAALLKPAPAQYHPNDLDDVDGDVSQLDEPGRQAPADAEHHDSKGRPVPTAPADFAWNHDAKLHWPAPRPVQLPPLMESASPADALRPNDRHGMVGATAAEQVRRHASEPDCEPIADWVAKRGLPGVPASLQPLTARVERLVADGVDGDGEAGR